MQASHYDSDSWSSGTRYGSPSRLRPKATMESLTSPSPRWYTHYSPSVRASRSSTSPAPA